MKKIVLVVGFLLAIPLLGISQKIYSAQGIAKVRMEANVSRAETRELARQQAKHQAIETVFGSYVSKDAYVDIEEGASDVTIRASNQLQGEWLKTTQETFREETRKVKDEFGTSTEIWVVCELEGKVREFEAPPVAYTFTPQNCPLEACATTEFKNGESFYLSFQTPQDGFLSVYLVDEEQAYRILPYQEMPNVYLDHVPVKADQSYTFFVPGKAHDYFEDFNYFMTDEIYLETAKKQELFKVYVIFSPEPYAKPILDHVVEEDTGFEVPRTLPKRIFEVWVQDNRIYDANFYYQTQNIRVK